MVPVVSEGGRTGEQITSVLLQVAEHHWLTAWAPGALGDEHGHVV